jgi:hypothetical protein
MSDYDSWKLASPADYEQGERELNEDHTCPICNKDEDDCGCTIACDGCHLPNHECVCDEAYESQF